MHLSALPPRLSSHCLTQWRGLGTSSVKPPWVAPAQVLECLASAVFQTEPLCHWGHGSPLWVYGRAWAPSPGPSSPGPGWGED